MSLLIDEIENAADQTTPLRLPQAGASERRRGIRVRQDRPIKVYEPRSGRYIGGRTLDISATGLRIELPSSSPVRDGAVLNLHVGVAVGGEPLAHRRSLMPARVVWTSRRVADGRGCVVAGVELIASIAAHLDAA